MQIAFRSRNVNIGSGQRERMEERLSHLAKFLGGIEKAEICLYEEKNPRIAEREVCEVAMYGHGHVVRAKGAGFEIMEAFDRVVEKLEHRLEKLKGKLLGRTQPHHRADVAKAASNGNGHRGPVKTKTFRIESMTPSEAILHMELLSHSFYFFTNEDTGSPAVVYERSDGTIGLIDSEVSV
ncbi:MAG: ribosome-associated translation inhibitor RaiA [Actinomycetota bacterium]|nr:MAG: ribosome-associated translation inhibitor RaiA [Actinomycetota bacterium]